MFIVGKENPILHKPCDEITRQFARSPEMKRLARDMALTMTKARGAGLSAPQIGINGRIIVVTTGPGKFATLVNPVLSLWSAEEEEAEEGCLSLPGERYAVKRYQTITIVARSLKGKVENKFEASGPFARVLQHEIDHCNGILIADVGTRILDDEKPGETAVVAGSAA